MEELFVGNSVILLFWVYITFIIEVEGKRKKIMLMYLITYITNILNIVPTIQSYGIMLLALFFEIEFWEDDFKKRIVNSIWEKVIDFFYLMTAQYALVSFSFSLFFSSNWIEYYLDGYYLMGIKVLSGILMYWGCKNVSSEKFEIATFDTIKKKIDEKERYRNFLQKEECICEPGVVLSIEDSNFYYRGDRYTFFNTYYLQRSYLQKLFDLMRRFFHSSNKRNSLKQFMRGYSTIEMQLLRTLAIEEGFNCVFRRKIFEILYAKLFWKNLKTYYEECECNVEPFKDYLLYLYLRSARCLNRGQEKRFEEVVGARKNIENFSKEELFVLVLCFSGKIKRDYVLEMYSDIIDIYELDRDRLKELVEFLNE